MKMTRREFIKHSGRAGVGATAGMSVLGSTFPAKIVGANERINVGFIGVGNRGTQLLREFLKFDDVRVAALCDVYEPYRLRDNSRVHPRYVKELGRRIPKMAENLGSDVARYKDFRELLDRKDIGAVCIATPDHWHAIQTVLACQAGKDVYVEKPLTITIREGRRMVQVAKETGRIVQVGLNRRGSTIYRNLAERMHQGLLGKVTVARAARISNMFPDGIGRAKPEPPPKDLDWDLWLGPRAFRPYQFNIAPYKFRWWSDYSSQMGNWGVHYMDAIRWLTGEKAPSAVSAHGGKWVLNDDRTIPDTMEVLFEFKSGMIVKFSIHEAAGGPLIPNGEIELRGTRGNLVVDSRRFTILPAHAGQFQEWDSLIEAESFEMQERENITANLIRNFLDNVKSRGKVWCDLEEGHRSTTFAHLANISLQLGQRLEWDAEREEFVDNAKANELLHYEYRKPWKLG